MRIQKVKFRFGPDGTTATSTELIPSAFTLFVGPNNGGKTRALTEIRQTILPEGMLEGLVTNEVTLKSLTKEEAVGKRTELEVEKLEGELISNDYLIFNVDGQRTQVHWPSVEYGLAQDANPHAKRESYKTILGPYVGNLDGMSRLQLADGKPGQRRGALAIGTIGRLFSSTPHLDRVRHIVKKAFGRFLVIDPTNMQTIEYRLSNIEPPTGIEFSLADDAQLFFSAAQPMRSASDGTRAFVGIISEVLAGNKEVYFIDEPEAFLHPSLANLLGREICRNLAPEAQLFAATHSPDFLLGCVTSGAQINVVRLTYDGSVGSARILESDALHKLANDPLLRSAGVISGLFHDGALVVEGDADRAFYGEIFHRLHSLEDVSVRNLVPMNAQNKQTMPSITDFLRSMGVPAAMILDIDWLKEDGLVATRYFNAAGIPSALQDGYRSQRSAIRHSLEGADINYKRQGGVEVLGEADRLAADSFFDAMEVYGIFTVRNGELESWLSNLDVSRQKTGWVTRIFEAMGSNPSDDSYARPTEGDVWDFVRSVLRWMSDPARRGMPTVN